MRTNVAFMVSGVVIYALVLAVSGYAQETRDANAAESKSDPTSSERFSREVRENQKIGVREQQHSQPPSQVVGMRPETQEPGVKGEAKPSALRTISTHRKIVGGIIGAVGGCFAGQLIGIAIEGGRDAIAGPMIGAPVGAVAGGILGYKFLF